MLLRKNLVWKSFSHSIIALMLKTPPVSTPKICVHFKTLRNTLRKSQNEVFSPIRTSKWNTERENKTCWACLWVNYISRFEFFRFPGVSSLNNPKSARLSENQASIDLWQVVYLWRVWWTKVTSFLLLTFISLHELTTLKAENCVNQGRIDDTWRSKGFSTEDQRRFKERMINGCFNLTPHSHSLSRVFPQLRPVLCPFQITTHQPSRSDYDWWCSRSFREIDIWDLIHSNLRLS